MGRAWLATAACVAGTGCGQIFGLDSPVLQAPGDASPADSVGSIDAPCMTGGTHIFGARSGGTGQVSMTDAFVVDQPNRQQNYGAAPTLALCTACSALGMPWDNSNAISLIRFDLAAICPSASVQSADLLLDTTSDNLGAGTVEVYVVRESWDEGAGPASGTSGAVSWRDRRSGIAWALPGVGAPSSRDSSPVASFVPGSVNTTYTITLPASVIQSWVAAPSSNDGLALAIVSGSSDVQFYSREAATIAQRPGLSITLAMP